jgi:hypothetical protein
MTPEDRHDDEAASGDGDGVILEVLLDGSRSAGNGGGREPRLLTTLVRELARERRQQVELTRLLLTALELMMREQVALRDDVAGLSARVHRLERLSPGAELAEGELVLGDDARARALCAESRQARRRSSDVYTEAVALIGRASELMAESRARAPSDGGSTVGRPDRRRAAARGLP